MKDIKQSNNFETHNLKVRAYKSVANFLVLHYANKLLLRDDNRNEGDRKMQEIR